MPTLNEQIQNRVFTTQYDDDTYYTQDLYDYLIDNINDPDILFKHKILGFYKQKYKWTKEEALEFIENNLEKSRGHYVIDEWFSYDWGSGLNSITKDKMYSPQLDHIIPKSEGGTDHPSNMRIRDARLNQNKGDTNTDIEFVASILDMISDLENPGKYAEPIIQAINEKLG